MAFEGQYKNPEAIAGYISNECPRIDAYWLLGDAGAVTLKGFFVRRDGKQTGSAVSTSIPLADGSNNPVQVATSIPSDAVGFIGNLSGAIRWGLNLGSTNDSTLFTDLKTNYTNYPKRAAADSLTFGSVAVV